MQCGETQGPHPVGFRVQIGRPLDRFHVPRILDGRHRETALQGNQFKQGLGYRTGRHEEQWIVHLIHFSWKAWPKTGRMALTASPQAALPRDPSSRSILMGDGVRGPYRGSGVGAQTASPPEPPDPEFRTDPS